MRFNFQRQLKTLAVAGVLSLGIGQSAWAGLFCGCGNDRPYYSPACEPTWGYHQTCWRRFPPLQPCTGWGDHCAACEGGCGAALDGQYTPDGYVNDAGQMMPYGGTHGDLMAPQAYPGGPLVLPSPGGEMGYSAPQQGNVSAPAAPQSQPALQPQRTLQPQPEPQSPPALHSQPLPDGGPQYQPQPEPLQPYPGSLPPLPDQNSSSIRHFPNVYRQTGQPVGPFPIRGVHHQSPSAAQPLMPQQNHYGRPEQYQNYVQPVYVTPQSTAGMPAQMQMSQPQQMQMLPQQNRRVPVRGVSHAPPPSRYGFPAATEGTSSPFSFLSRITGR